MCRLAWYSELVVVATPIRQKRGEYMSGVLRFMLAIGVLLALLRLLLGLKLVVIHPGMSPLLGGLRGGSVARDVERVGLAGGSSTQGSPMEVKSTWRSTAALQRLE